MSVNKNVPNYSNGKIAAQAFKAALIKLAPAAQAKNPVMLLVYISAILTTALAVLSFYGVRDAPFGFTAGSSRTSRKRSPRGGARPRPTR